MKTTTGPELALKIKQLCASKGITIKQFERDTGLSNGYVRKLEIQKSTPSSDRLQRIADYFGTTTDFLLGQDTSGKKGANAVKVPILGRVAAGIPIMAAENVMGYEEITRKMASKGEIYALVIKGDSMSPFIMNGDKVIVLSQDDADDGDIVIALIDGRDGVCKQLKRTSSGIMLISKNPAYEPMVFTHAEIDTEPVRIIGKVLEVRRSL